MSTPGAIPAAPGRRLLALVIDVVAVLVLGGGFVLAGGATQAVALAQGAPVPPGPSPLTVLGLAMLGIFGVVQWWWQGTRGFTVGSRLVGVRTLSARTGRPVGMVRILPRMIVMGLALLVPVLGPLVLGISVVADRGGRRQGWHDKIAGTVVFDIGVGVDPSTVRSGWDETNRRRDRLFVGPRTTPAELDVPHAAAGWAASPQEPLTAGDLVLVGDGEPHARPEPSTDTQLIASVPLSRHQAALRESSDLRAADRARPTGDVAAPVAAAPLRAVERVVPTAPYESVGGPAHPPLDDEVERTRLRSARSRVAYAPSRSRSTTRPRATLLLWDNRVVVLDGMALIGRNPSPRAGEELPVQVIPVVDRGRSVSKTHLAIGVDGDGVWLRDRNSTNGTIVTLADGQQILCAPEQTVRVPVGASVAFGDYWLTVTG